MRYHYSLPIFFFFSKTNLSISSSMEKNNRRAAKVRAACYLLGLWLPLSSILMFVFPVLGRNNLCFARDGSRLRLVSSALCNHSRLLATSPRNRIEAINRLDCNRFWAHRAHTSVAAVDRFRSFFGAGIRRQRDRFRWQMWSRNNCKSESESNAKSE